MLGQVRCRRDPWQGQGSPLPGAEVDDQKAVILVGVDVMEEVEGRGAVLDVEEPAFLLLCHVKPNLRSEHAFGLGTEK